MNENKNILISGYYGFNNSGDDAILKAIVKDLKEYKSSVEITAFSKNPPLTKDAYNIDAVNRFSIRDVIKAIKNCDLLLSGGGSLLQDVTSTRSLLYYLILMKLAKVYEKPVMVYANGIGPIDGRANRFLTRRVLNKVDLITLRDENSRIFLEDLKVVNENIHITADPVFTLDPIEEKEVLKIFKSEKIPYDKPLVGVSIRNWENTENLVKVLGRAIDYIIGKYDVNVILIPMHYPEDLSISNEILKKVSSNGCYVLEEKYEVEEIMGIIKSLEIIIAMRLHSLIYAATQDIPMVGIVYDPKVEGFLESIDMAYMCPVENIEYGKLIQNINYVWKNRKLLKSRLIKLDEKMRKEALNNVHMALDLLKK